MRGEAASATRRLATSLTRAGSPERWDRSGATALEGAAAALRAEARRGALQASRVDEAEAEAAVLRLRGEADAQRAANAEAAAARAREAAGAAERKAAGLAAELASVRGPEHEAGQLRADNGRLVALLEGTKEYSALLADCALAGRHYVSLADVLAEQGLLAQAYTPLRDRPAYPPVDVRAAEAALGAWVPRAAVAVAAAFVARGAAYGLPVALLYQLLLELNATWRAANAVQLAALKAGHEKALQGERRRWQQREPYDAVLAESELTHLRRLLRTAGRSGEEAQGPVARMRDAAKRAGSEEARLLLEWGLATIETLGRQLNEATEENLGLRRRLRGGLEEEEGGPGSLHEY